MPLAFGAPERAIRTDQNTPMHTSMGEKGCANRLRCAAKAACLRVSRNLPRTGQFLLGAYGRRSMAIILMSVWARVMALSATYSTVSIVTHIVIL